MAKSWRCGCGARNTGDRLDCRDCGGAAPEVTPPTPKAQEPARCWLDGSLLAEDGRCEASGGFPVPKDGSPLKCPLACPICRGGLSWDGGCSRCHGSPTGDRDTWTSPGARYVVKFGHRVLDPEAEPGRRACTPAETQAFIGGFRRLVDHTAVKLVAERERARLQPVGENPQPLGENPQLEEDPNAGW